MRWAHGYLPVPKVVEQGSDGHVSWLDEEGQIDPERDFHGESSHLAKITACRTSSSKAARQLALSIWGNSG